MIRGVTFRGLSITASQAVAAAARHISRPPQGVCHVCVMAQGGSPVNTLEHDTTPWVRVSRRLSQSACACHWRWYVSLAHSLACPDHRFLSEQYLTEPVCSSVITEE